ncbi:MAG TPA: GtrA family protein [Candidatus Saccharimonas sp.]|nr:GtrA family protein [Candidatus Saccharimonas sp.]
MKKLIPMHVVRYVLAGGLAYAVELLSILAMSHFLHFSAELATACGFWIGLPTSFLLQKIFAFKDYEKSLKTISKQLGAYALLVAFNYVFTLIVVAMLPESWLIFSRTLALVITTLWNFAFYRIIFHGKNPLGENAKQFLHDAVRLKNKWVNGVLLAIPIIVFCIPLLMTGNKLTPGDPDYYFQIYEAFRRSVLEFGQIPMWNPWVAGGIPLFANVQFGMISLQGPLVLIFGAVMGLKVAILGYMLIGFYGFRKLFKDGFGTPNLRAALLAYIAMFSSFFVYRVMAGHFTFLMIAFVPWLLYFFLKRRNKKSWLWFALFYSLMVWSAPHYTTIMAAVVVGVWFLYEIIRLAFKSLSSTKWQVFWQEIKKDVLFFVKAGALIAAVCAYRLYFVVSFIKDRPRFEDTSNDPFTGLWQGLYSIWGPDQFNSPPKLTSHWGWEEAATYIGIGTLVCLLIVLGVWIAKKIAKKRAPFSYSIVLLLALFLSFFILGMGDFGPWSPYHLLNHLPVFNSMRVATRWLMWASLCVLFILAAYNGKKFSKIITVILAFTVIELFVIGAPNMASSYIVIPAQYRSAQAPFDQEYKYNIPRPQYANNKEFLSRYSYDENLTETTRNNLGQVIAGDSLVDTRQPNSTIRCGANQGCKLISDNATLVYWSPNKIVLQRTAPGPIVLNMNFGNGWQVNGVYAFASAPIVDTLHPFIVNDPSQVLTLKYVPKFSPNWLLQKIKL